MAQRKDSRRRPSGKTRSRLRHMNAAPGRRKWNRRLAIAGVGIPLAVSLALAYIDLSRLMVIWLSFLLGVLSAALFRSWWAVPIVPAAAVLGTLLGTGAVRGTLVNPASPNVLLGAVFFVLLAVLPLALGATVGAPLGKEVERLL